MNVGDIFLAGDFPVKVLQTSGRLQGSFTGNGYVTVPFLGQAMVKVGWSRIGVNTDHKLIGGVVMTAFDSTATQVTNVSTAINVPEDMSVILTQLAGITADTSTLTIQNLGNAINTSIDSLSQSAQDSIRADVANLAAVKNSYDSLEEYR